MPVVRPVASAGAYVGSTGLLAALVAVQDNSRLIEWMPDGVTPFVLALIPAAITFVGGWAAKHSPRSGTLR
ncbi:holin [Streptomyces scopuliridis]|uniref:holin n=1 Tax=Streptomyces scopuliridis TaxID=452529 RepID=UPI0036A98770